MANGYLLQGIGGGLQQGLNTILQLVEAQRDREARARELAEQRAFTSGEARLGREHETALSDTERAERRRQFDLQQSMQAQGMNLEAEQAGRREFLEGLRSQNIVALPGAYEAVSGRDINAGLDPSTLRKFEVSPQDLIRGQRTAPTVSPEQLPQILATASAKARAGHTTVPVEGFPAIASSEEYDPYRSEASMFGATTRQQVAQSQAVDRMNKGAMAAMSGNPRALELKGLLGVVNVPERRAAMLEELALIGANMAQQYITQDPLLSHIDPVIAGRQYAQMFAGGGLPSPGAANPPPAGGKATAGGLGLPNIPGDTLTTPTAPPPPSGGGSSVVNEFLQRKRSR